MPICIRWGLQLHCRMDCDIQALVSEIFGQTKQAVVENKNCSYSYFWADSELAKDSRQPSFVRWNLNYFRFQIVLEPMLETCKFLHIESCVVQARGIPAVKATRGINLSCKQHLSEAHAVCV